MRAVSSLPVHDRGRGDTSLSPTTAAVPVGDEGSVTAFIVVAVLALLLFLGVTVDCGQALTEKTQALGQAQDAARAGAQALDLGILRDSGVVVLGQGDAVRAADAYLNRQDINGTASATIRQVTVTVTRSFPTHLLTLVGIDTLTVHATGSARAVTQAAP